MALRRRFRATLQGNTSISHFKAESSTSNPVLAAAGGDMGEVPKRTKNYQRKQTRTKNAPKEPEKYQKQNQRTNTYQKKHQKSPKLTNYSTKEGKTHQKSHKRTKKPKMSLRMCQSRLNCLKTYQMR